MDSDFGNDEFFDGMDKQTARELGLSAGDESTVPSCKSNPGM